MTKKCYNQTTASWGRDTEHQQGDNQSKAANTLFPSEMIAKLERVQILYNKTRTQHKKKHNQWEKQ